VIATKRKTEDLVLDQFQKSGFDQVSKVGSAEEAQVLEHHFPVNSASSEKAADDNRYKRKHLKELHKLGWIYGPQNRRKLTETIELPNCTVKLDRENDYLVTLYPDGTKVEALPGKKLDYYETAEKTGYGVDIAALSREHELFHTLVSQAEGHPVSPTLWAVAHNFAPGTAPRNEQFKEEVRVLNFQSFTNGNEDAGNTISESLRALKDKALKLIRR
jgi:hypothetical protein